MNEIPSPVDPRIAYVVRDGGHAGPYTRAELRHYWAVGRLQAHEPVWTDGMDDPMRLVDFLAGRPMVQIGC